jgi:hypothetical protein
MKIEWPRAFWVLLGLAIEAPWASPAGADTGSVRACLDAAEDGQKLRDGGAYVRARERFIACAADECPGEVRKSCVGWLGELEKLTPTVVFGVESGGNEVTDVRVLVDGKMVVERIDGKPVALDPGAHRFRFERPGERAVEQTLLVRAGDKERLIGVRFAPDASASPLPPPSSPSPTAGTHASVYAFGAAGIAGIATGAVLDLSGYIFLRECNNDPSCGGGHERAEVEWRFVAGDLLLGVGVLCGAVAWLTRPRDSVTASARPTASLSLGPTRKGSSLGLTVSF